MANSQSIKKGIISQEEADKRIAKSETKDKSLSEISRETDVSGEQLRIALIRKKGLTWP